MRKSIAIISYVILAFAALLSLRFPQNLKAANIDTKGNLRPAVWRASSTCTTLNYAILSTESVIIHGISVDSPTVNQAGSSYLIIFNSTAAPMSSNSGIFLSSGPLVPTNVNATAGGLPMGPQYFYDMWYTSGAVVNKVGVACTTILWDFTANNQSFTTAAQVTPWRP